MIHVLANNKQAANDFLKRHKLLEKKITIHLNYSSYFQFINDIINNQNIQDYACLVHDDVTLPTYFEYNLHQLISTLKLKWPNWGICGNMGVLPFQIGPDAAKIVRYIFDSHGGPNYKGAILPSTCIDGNIMLLNLPLIRKKNLCIPNFKGFQLYDLSLSIETIRAGLAVLTAPHLICHHNSKCSNLQLDNAANSTDFQKYFSSIVKEQTIETLNGQLPLSISSNSTNAKRMSIKRDTLKNASIGRPLKKLSIVVRTRGLRPNLLPRTITSIRYFIACIKNQIDVSFSVITDTPSNELSPEVKKHITDYARTTHHPSSRINLIIHAVNQSIHDDYIWFIDDDDWIFPNKAVELASLISIADSDSMFFIGTRHFKENITDNGSIYSSDNYENKADRYFSPKNWILSFSGTNHIPFCGFIFPPSMLTDIKWEDYGQIDYCEDFLIQLHCIEKSSCIHILDELLCGISIRSSGNTVTEANSNKWKQSLIDMGAHQTITKLNSQLFSVSSCLSQLQLASPQLTKTTANPTYSLEARNSLEKNILLLCRLLYGILKFIMQPKSWLKRIYSGYLMLKKGSVRDMIRRIMTVSS